MSRPLKQFCPQGHDTFAVGRVNNGQCKTCFYARNRDHCAERRQRIAAAERRQHDPIGPLLPAAPLRELFHDNRIHARISYEKVMGVSEREANRRVNALFTGKYLSLDNADRWCIVSGWPLDCVYPDLGVGAV